MSELRHAGAVVGPCPVKNEAANLRDCLTSISFAQEIGVVDSASTDGTQAIANVAGARIVQFIWNGKFPREKTGHWKIFTGNMNGC